MKVALSSTPAKDVVISKIACLVLSANGFRLTDLVGLALITRPEAGGRSSFLLRCDSHGLALIKASLRVYALS